jgi:hypothetical protein
MKERNNKIKITKIQKEILVGIILGDGHLEKSINGLSYRLKIEQSINKKEYVEHLYEIFKDWTNSGIKRNRNNFYFQTKFTKSLLFYGKQFYNKDKKKIIPKLIHRWLSPRTIAYWYMDDGSLKSKQSKGVLFNTQGFTFKEVTYLSKILTDKYKLITKLRKQKAGYQIYVSGYSYENLYNIIYPFLIKSMYYKFPTERKK